MSIVSAGRGDLEPTLVGHQGVEEAAEPAVLVDVLLRFRPGAELLAVVAEQADRPGPLLREPGQVADRFLGRGEGDRVPQLLAAGEDAQHAAFVLGDQVALELRIGQAGHLEVEVVEDRVLDAGVDQVVGEGLLPDPFGNPHAADGRAEAVLQPAGVAADLADAVPAGDHRQDRLEERPADDLDAALGGQFGQAIDILGVDRVEPFHQRTAGVQGDSQRLVAAEDVEKRQIAVFVGLLENVFEVTDGLVIVEGEDQADGVGHSRFRSEGSVLSRDIFVYRQL